jgi:FKBP-type peptidyl-prolyl cis-trans isomerase (trigger factor)
MNAKVEKIQQNVVKLEITVEAEKFNEALKKAEMMMTDEMGKLTGGMNIPGLF